MWVRKSPAQIAREEHKARFTPVPALVGASLVALCFCLLNWGGWTDKFGMPHPARSLQQALSGFPVLAIFLFVFLYIAQVFLGARATSPLREAFICERCHKGQPFTPSHTCQCGGRIEPLRHWRWEEHPNT